MLDEALDALPELILDALAPGVVNPEKARLLDDQ